MRITAQKLAASTVLVVPALLAIGDQLLQHVYRDAPATTGDDAVALAMADLAAVDANRGLWEATSWLFYGVALLTIPAVLVLWRLAVQGSRRWAWGGAAVGVGWVLGQFVHLYGYFGMSEVYSAYEDRRVAAELFAAEGTSLLNTVLFVPYLVGSLATPLVLAIALRRAGVIRTWGVWSVAAGTVLFLVLGSTGFVTTVWAVALIAGFLPAVRLALRDAADGRAEELRRPATPAVL